MPLIVGKVNVLFETCWLLPQKPPIQITNLGISNCLFQNKCFVSKLVIGAQTSTLLNKNSFHCLFGRWIAVGQPIYILIRICTYIYLNFCIVSACFSDFYPKKSYSDFCPESTFHVNFFPQPSLRLTINIKRKCVHKLSSIYPIKNNCCCIQTNYISIPSSSPWGVITWTR